MVNQPNKMVFGLLGYPLSHSYSKKLFNERFSQKPNLEYNLYEYKSLSDFFEERIFPDELSGFNITIPHKCSIVSKLDEMTKEVDSVGACNTIALKRSNGNSYLIGHNTDVIGFGKFLDTITLVGINNCIIMGTGGSSKAVEYVLQKRDIPVIKVSRNFKSDNIIGYDNISDHLNSHTLIVNCTPVGMFPNNKILDFPYERIDNTCILIDLIYNPLESNFLKLGKNNGANTYNGLPMLNYQAEASWEFWGLI